jgi:hypothetical protein
LKQYKGRFQRLKVIHLITSVPREAAIWLAALFVLACLDPGANHLSLCPLHHLDLICPGCGLGRSIALLLRGEWKASFHAHPLGIFAVIVLSYRIYQLTHPLIRNYGQRH